MALLSHSGQFLRSPSPLPTIFMQQLRSSPPSVADKMGSTEPALAPSRSLQVAAFVYVLSSLVSLGLSPVYRGYPPPSILSSRLEASLMQSWWITLKPHLGSAPVSAAPAPHSGRPPQRVASWTQPLLLRLLGRGGSVEAVNEVQCYQVIRQTLLEKILMVMQDKSTRAFQYNLVRLPHVVVMSQTWINHHPIQYNLKKECPQLTVQYSRRVKPARLENQTDVGQVQHTHLKVCDIPGWVRWIRFTFVKLV